MSHLHLSRSPCAVPNPLVTQPGIWEKSWTRTRAARSSSGFAILHLVFHGARHGSAQGAGSYTCNCTPWFWGSLARTLCGIAIGSLWGYLGPCRPSLGYVETAYATFWVRPKTAGDALAETRLANDPPQGAARPARRQRLDPNSKGLALDIRPYFRNLLGSEVHPNF